MKNDIRQRIIDILKLWSSKNNQIEYQNNVPIAQVSAEIFCQWEECYYPETDEIKNVFNENELKSLADFNNVLNEISNLTPVHFPDIYKFVETDEWKIINKAAIETLKRLKK